MKKSILCILMLFMFCSCSNATSQNNSLHEEEYKDLEIIDKKVFKYNEIETYLLTLHNPNEHYGVYLPDFVFTYRDKDNRILDSYELGFMYIAPKDTYILSEDNYIEYDYDTLDIEVKHKEGSFYRDIHPEYGTSKDFEFNNVSLFCEDIRKVTGEITNNSDNYYSSIDVEIVLKFNNEIVGAERHFIDDVESNGTAVFSIDLPKYYDYDDVELYAYGYSN